MKSPFSGGLGPGGARTLYLLGLLQAVKALGLLGIAEALASGIASLFEGTDSWRSALLLGAGAVLARAAAAWLVQWYATRAALGAKESLRAQLLDRLVDPSELGVGEAAALATRGLDDLDPYYRTVLPAAVGAAVIPLAIGVRILLADPLSAVIVAATVPLIPVFMILIGQHTQQRVDAAAGALSRLADHLVELARGLPVLVGLGRVEEQAWALHGVSERYRLRTLGTLRTAFLSALALELIATLSVALVAVTVGIRLIGGDLGLEVGLLVLVLAPECYTPLREVGVAFHASQDGVAALDRVRSVIMSARPASVRDGRPAKTPIEGLSVERLIVRFAGRQRAAVDELSFSVAPGEVIAVTGPSGAGKSTVLRAIAGRLGSTDAIAEGRVDTPATVAWLPQHPHTVTDTVRGELALYAGEGEPHELSALLEELGLSSVADQDPADLSPGELRRVAFARAVLRVEAGAKLLLLDEPTAHLDEVAARAVERVIARLRGTVSMVLVSHDPRVIALADRVVPVDRMRPTGTPVGVTSAAPLAAPEEGAASADEVLRSPCAAVPSPVPARGDGMRLLASLLRPVSGRLLAAVALGSLAALSAASLTAVSGWLIVRAAQEPAIMYLLVAIVGVRFFGLARSGLRYAERLVTHDAVFGSITVLRDRLWSAVARRGTASPALLRGGSTFDLLVITADQVRDLAPRVLLPPMVALVTAAAALVTSAILHAAVLPVFALALLVALVIAPGIAVLADRRATGHVRADQRETARRITGVLQAADDLRGNGVDERVLADLQKLDARSGAAARRSSWALGLGGAVVVAALTGLAVTVVGLCAPAVAAGDIGVEIVAVLALLPLALIDPMLAVVEAVQHVPALAGALQALAPVIEEPARGDRRPGCEDALPGPAPIDAIGALRVTGLSARWPGSADPVLAGLDAGVGRGEWLGVTGPSGSGKSTFLSVLLRYLEPDHGAYEVDDQDVRGIDTATLRSRMAWCPQEAHLFASTIRANLLLARRAGDAPSDAELRAALRKVGLGELVDAMATGLDTQVGAGGSRLSGGERQRLAVARALLTRADVILLDEPTAHLDAETADAMVDDLRLALRDRAVVIVTHRREDLRPEDRRVDLGRRNAATR